MRLLLASQSPRRRQLIAELGFPVQYINISVDEQRPADLPAAAVAEYLARHKAAAYPSDKLADDDVLVTADTVVVHRDSVLGKPADRNEAIAMLRSLSGRSHTVYTGVCLRSTSDEVSFTESTTVCFRKFTDKDIDYYVDNYRP